MIDLEGGAIPSEFACWLPLPQVAAELVLGAGAMDGGHITRTTPTDEETETAGPGGGRKGEGGIGNLKNESARHPEFPFRVPTSASFSTGRVAHAGTGHGRSVRLLDRSRYAPQHPELHVNPAAACFLFRVSFRRNTVFCLARC